MRRVLALCALLGGISLVGCGTGSGTGSSIVSGTSRASLLITDSPREDYGHVWATIYHVELTVQSGSPVVVYDNSTGVMIDLKTLRDATGQRFSFLGGATIPAGTYTGISVTIGSTLQLVKNGVATGTPLTVDSSIPQDSLGHPTLSITYATPKTIATATSALVVDFDLASFTVSGTTIKPVIKDGALVGITDRNRHNDGDYDGTVSGLTGTAPTLTFVLTGKNGSATNVMTTASTSLTGAGTLANGSVVEVNGALDTTTQVLVATQVEVRAANENANIARVRGVVSSPNATAGTFVVTPVAARNFVPTMSTANIVTNASSVFEGESGAKVTPAAFFAALATTPNAAVSGTYDSATNTLTATRLNVINPALAGGWEHDDHRFHDGVNQSNWGGDHFKGDH